MSDDRGSAPGSGPGGPRDGEAAWQRRRRLEAVFGDVLPSSTSDDVEEETGAATRDSDAWLRAQVPPHHGGD